MKRRAANGVVPRRMTIEPGAADCEDELRFDGAHEHLKSFFRSEIERSELVLE